MLQKLNERIQGVVAWVVIILIASTFTLFGVDYYMQSHQASSLEVTVNGEPISKQAFELNYRRARQQRDPALFTAASEKALKNEVLQDSISNLIAVQGAIQSGFSVSKEQATAAIVNIPQFQQDGHFSTDRYQQALNAALFTPETFQREVQQGMLLNQQKFALIGSAFAIAKEINHFVGLYLQERSYAFLRIPAKLFLDAKRVTEKDIESYYQRNQTKFQSPEQVSIDYVRASLQSVKRTINVTDDDILRYYDENKDIFRSRAKWKVAHILFAFSASDEQAQNQSKQQAEQAYKILKKNPEQFESWVLKHSADKLSYAKKGILPWIYAGQTEFDPALVRLTKTNPISAPLKTSNGYELFKLITNKPSALKTVAQVKNRIIDQLTADAAQVKYAQLLDQLTELSYQTPDSLKPIADELHLRIEHSLPFSKQGGNSDITRSKALINAAFTHELIDLGTNSEPIQINNDTVVVFRVNKHILASKKKLGLVREDIIRTLTLSEAKKEAQAFGERIIAADSALQSQLIKDKKLQWHEVADASRDTDKVDPVINYMAFKNLKSEKFTGQSLENGDYVLMNIVAVRKGSFDKLDKEHQASVVQQVETNFGLMDYDLYINSLVKKAKIEQPK